MQVGKQVTFPKQAAPSTPASGNVVIYAKSDGRMYLKDDTGAEVAMAAGSTATNFGMNIAVSAMSYV